MFRSLPPAGHSIPISTCLQMLGKTHSIVGSYLARMYPHGRIYLVSSGTAALTLAIKSLPISSEKREVVLPAYTCPSVAAAIIQSGLQPVLCDVHPENFFYDSSQLDTKIRNKTAAVVGVNLFGIPQKMNFLKELTESRGAFFIEDACQAFGNWASSTTAAPDGLSPNPVSRNFLGSFGDMGILSFGRGKPLSLMGGGAVIVNNPDCELAVIDQYDLLPARNGALARFPYFVNLMLYALFFHPYMYWIPNGLPWLRLGETRVDLDFSIEKADSALIRLGAFLQSQFESDRKHRLANAGNYISCLEEMRDNFLYMPGHEENNLAFTRFPLVFRNQNQREIVLSELKQKGFGATKMYPMPLTDQNGISAHLVEHQTCPGAIQISEGMLTLPLHSFVSADKIEEISRIFRKHL